LYQETFTFKFIYIKQYNHLVLFTLIGLVCM